MFSRSALFLVLGALLIFQVSGQGLLPDTQWANVQKLMQESINALKESGKKITTSINEVTKAEEAKIAQTRNDIKSEIKKAVTKLQKQADEAEVDIKDCLKEVSDGGDSIADSLLKGATQCVTDEVNKAKKSMSIVEEFEKEVNAFWQDVKKQWDGCQSSPNLILCKGQVVADAALKEGKYAKRQEKLVSETATSSDMLHKNTESCVTSKLAPVSGQVTSKISSLEHCVQKKIARS